MAGARAKDAGEAAMQGLTPFELSEVLADAWARKFEPAPGRYHAAVVAFKRRLVAATLRQAGGNRTRAAKILGLQRTHLQRLIHELDVVGPDESPDRQRATAPQRVLGLVWLDVRGARVCLDCESIFDAAVVNFALCPVCLSSRTRRFAEHARSAAAAGRPSGTTSA